MEYIMIIKGGEKTLILKPERGNKSERDLIDLFKESGIYEIKILEEQSNVLDTPVSDCLIIKKIKTNE